MACVRRPGGTLFVKSSDRPFDEPQVLRWFDRRPPGGDLATTYLRLAPDPGGAAFVGSQPTWIWGVEHGINEHRVAIGNERIWTVDDARPAPPGLIGMDLVRLALERARSADDAVELVVDLLAAHGQGGSGHPDGRTPYWSSFLVVDPGGGWVVETSDREWVAQPVGDGAAVSNRLTLSTGWTRASAGVAPGTDWDSWRSPRIDTRLADRRLAATRRWIGGAGTAPTTPAGATGVLRDHGTGPWGAVGAPVGAVPTPPDGVREDWSHVTICMHIREHEATTASMIADLPEDRTEPVRAWVAPGNPCVAPFLPIAVAGPSRPAWPSVLGDVEAWGGFARLSRAVDAPGDDGRAALARVRSTFAPVEARAWAEAEELWASRAGAEDWEHATAAWDQQVRSVLAMLRVELARPPRDGG